MSPSQRRYWTGNGSERPRSCMMRTRSAGVIREWPSTPRMATRGSPGRMRSTTKMMRDTPMRVPRRRAPAGRDTCACGAPTSACSPGGLPRLRLALGQPNVVPADHVVDAEEGGRVLPLHLVVVGVVDLLVRDRDERRVLLQGVFRPSHHGPLLGVVRVRVCLVLVG